MGKGGREKKGKKEKYIIHTHSFLPGGSTVAALLAAAENTKSTKTSGSTVTVEALVHSVRRVDFKGNIFYKGLLR